MSLPTSGLTSTYSTYREQPYLVHEAAVPSLGQNDRSGQTVRNGGGSRKPARVLRLRPDEPSSVDWGRWAEPSKVELLHWSNNISIGQSEDEGLGIGRGSEREGEKEEKTRVRWT